MLKTLSDKLTDISREFGILAVHAKQVQTDADAVTFAKEWVDRGDTIRSLMQEINAITGCK